MYMFGVASLVLCIVSYIARLATTVAYLLYHYYIPIEASSALCLWEFEGIDFMINLHGCFTVYKLKNEGDLEEAGEELMVN